MPRRSPFVIELLPAEWRELEARSRRSTSPYREVARANIVLMAAAGLENKAIASRLDLPFQIVSKWRKRFFEERLAGLGGALSDRTRARVSPQRWWSPSRPWPVSCRAGSACPSPPPGARHPGRGGQPWTRGQHLRSHHLALAERGRDETLDPPFVDLPARSDFEAEAGRVLDLYARQFEGRNLLPDEYVISADEKTSMQARRRCHPTAPPAPARPMRVEHEYQRCGAWTYLAAWDVHRAKLFGRLERKTGIEPFGRLVDQVMLLEPYRSARTVFWVLDNGSSHRGEPSVERLTGAFPNLLQVHLPIHGSWTQPDRDLLLDRAAQDHHASRRRIAGHARR